MRRPHDGEAEVVVAAAAVAVVLFGIKLGQWTVFVRNQFVHGETRRKKMRHRRVPLLVLFIPLQLLQRKEEKRAQAACAHTHTRALSFFPLSVFLFSHYSYGGCVIHRSCSPLLPGFLFLSPLGLSLSQAGSPRRALAHLFRFRRQSLTVGGTK